MIGLHFWVFCGYFECPIRNIENRCPADLLYCFVLFFFSGKLKGRKKKDYHGLYWAAGTMAAVGASALMALSSKALMTAGAALALAIYSCMKGGGGGKGGGSHLTATLMEESTLVPHRQCAEAVVDISGMHNYPPDVERYPGSRKTVDIVSPAMPVYRIHQTSEDYSSSYGSSQSQSQAQYP